MDSASARVLQFPCRLGELTLWSPGRRLWVHNGGLRDTTPEDVLVEHFRAQQEDFDGALLLGIQVEAQEPRVQRRAGLLRYVPQSGQRYLVDLSGTFDAYMSAFGAKTRSTLGRKVRRFEREAGGELDFREYRGSARLREFLAPAREVSAKSYQEIMLDAGIPDDEAFREEMGDAGEHDGARGYLLYFQDRPVAYLYCPINQGVARYEYVGYDQDMRNLSPGTVLLMKVLELHFQDPDIHTFDFTEGGGEDSHKASFATDAVNRGNVYYLKTSISNLVIVASQMVSYTISNGLGTVLDTLGIKKYIKQVLRRLRRFS